MSSPVLFCRNALAPWHHCQRGLALAHPRAVQRARLSSRVQASVHNSLASTSSSSATRQQQQVMVAVDPATTSTSASQTRGGPSLPFLAVAFGAFALFAFIAKKLSKKGLDGNSSRYSVNLHLAHVMKDVNTVKIEDLSSDQIDAARARRSKERANHKLALEEIDLPQNHPFATKQVLSQEEQEQSLQNLRTRSMRRVKYEAMQADDEARAGPGANGRRR